MRSGWHQTTCSGRNFFGKKILFIHWILLTVPLNPNVFVTNELWGLKNLFTIWAHFAKRVTLGSFFIFLFGQHKVIKASSAPIKKWRWWGSRSTSIESKTDTTGRGRRVAVCRAAVERGGPAAVVKSPHEVKQRGQTHEIWSSRMLMTSLCLVLSFVCFLCCSVDHFFEFFLKYERRGTKSTPTPSSGRYLPTVFNLCDWML